MCLETQTISCSHLFSLFHFSLKGSFYNCGNTFRKWAKLIPDMSLWKPECWDSHWEWKKGCKDTDWKGTRSDGAQDRGHVNKRHRGEGRGGSLETVKASEGPRHLSAMLLLSKVTSLAPFVPQSFTIRGNSHVESWWPSDKVNFYLQFVCNQQGDAARGEAARCRQCFQQCSAWGGISLPENSYAVFCLLWWLVQFDTDLSNKNLW